MNAESQKTDHYRYERKFVVPGLNIHEIEALIKLHPAMFSEIYQPRFVNNLYFDSFTMKNYLHSVDGLKERMKVRIRWYDNLFGFIESPVLEIKVKSGIVGRKFSFSLMPFEFSDHFTANEISNRIQKSNIPIEVKRMLKSLSPTLLNCYNRKYFQSHDYNYRITIDNDIKFYRINSTVNTYSASQILDRNIILEIKYDPEHENGVNQIANRFPFRLARYSKYVKGIEMTFMME